MPLWDKTTSLPKNLDRESKRNVVATDVGFVRRQVYTDADGNARTKEEILVSLDGVANSSNFGAPSISDVWHSKSTAVINTPIDTFVSFDEPVSIAAAAKIAVANTVGGSAKVGVAAATPVLAGNTLKFTWTPTVAGTYKVQAQSIANNTAVAINLRSTNSGTETATLVISGPNSNTAGIVIVTAS